jgi:hypothetical protein
MKTKECIKCKQILPIEEMVKSKQYKDGIFPYCKPCMKTCSLEQRKNNPLQRILANAKSSAKKRNIEFSLNIEDIVIPEFCPYLGIKLTITAGEGLLETAATIDRIDNLKGYTKDNIMIISHKANRVKGELSKEMLLYLANNILTIHQV